MNYCFASFSGAMGHPPGEIPQRLLGLWELHFTVLFNVAGEFEYLVYPKAMPMPSRNATGNISQTSTRGSTGVWYRDAVSASAVGAGIGAAVLVAVIVAAAVLVRKRRPQSGSDAGTARIQDASGMLTIMPSSLSVSPMSH
jgi:hypothetical protein